MLARALTLSLSWRTPRSGRPTAMTMDNNSRSLSSNRCLRQIPCGLGYGTKQNENSSMTATKQARAGVSHGRRHPSMPGRNQPTITTVSSISLPQEQRCHSLHVRQGTPRATCGAHRRARILQSEASLTLCLSRSGLCQIRSRPAVDDTAKIPPDSPAMRDAAELHCNLSRLFCPRVSFQGRMLLAAASRPTPQSQVSLQRYNRICMTYAASQPEAQSINEGPMKRRDGETDAYIHYLGPVVVLVHFHDELGVNHDAGLAATGTSGLLKLEMSLPECTHV